MTQRERDRLVVLKKAQKKLITQRQAAAELQLSERQVRRILVRLKEVGDRAVVHGLRGRRSNRRLSEEMRERVVGILSQEVYRGFGPTLASEYLAKKHKIAIGREALRKLMMETGLWRGHKQKIEEIHEWRPRRSSRGEMVQWDTSEHDWLEGRGEKLYLIHMIDDATSELLARFVRSDSTEQNMRLLWSYLERNGRPLAFYTDKASLFRNTPKVKRNERDLPRDERTPLPPTQIGRALQELGIAWIAAHSPQAKGRVERSFGTAQDRLVKGLRVAGAPHAGAGQPLLGDGVPTLVEPASGDCAGQPHRCPPPAGRRTQHRCGSQSRGASAGEQQLHRAVAGKFYQILREGIGPGLRGAVVRLEQRLDGSLALRFRDRYLAVKACGTVRPTAQALPKPTSQSAAESQPTTRPQPSPALREAMKHLLQHPGLPVWIAAEIDKTLTSDMLED